LEFVLGEETGLVCEPTPEKLAEAMDYLWKNRKRARRLGEAGREHYDRLDITWDRIVQRLLS
jgi:glycosyltransferase involved in cell wall biosynthesis